MVDLSRAVILDGGNGLSVQHERIAEIIRDLDPNLELAYIPSELRSSFDRHPFCVRHKNGYIVMTLAENEVDHRVIAKLLKRDTNKGSVIDTVDAERAAYDLVNIKMQLEDIEEKREFTKSVLKSPKSTYRHKGIVY